jgi:hypothetical protein
VADTSSATLLLLTQFLVCCGDRLNPSLIPAVPGVNALTHEWPEVAYSVEKLENAASAFSCQTK